MLVALLMDFVTTTFKPVLISVPVITRHSTEYVVTSFRYLLLVCLVNILGQLPSTFNVDGMGSLDCTIANKRVVHQVPVKVDAVDEDVQVRNARLRIKVKTGENLCSVQIEFAFSFLLAFLGLDFFLELIKKPNRIVVPVFECPSLCFFKGWGNLHPKGRLGDRLASEFRFVLLMDGFHRSPHGERSKPLAKVTCQHYVCTIMLSGIVRHG